MTLTSARPVRIQICGALAIERDGQRLDAGLPGHQGRLLFTYLVVNRHRHVPRDELAEALWLEPDPAVDYLFTISPVVVPLIGADEMRRLEAAFRQAAGPAASPAPDSDADDGALEGDEDANDAGEGDSS